MNFDIYTAKKIKNFKFCSKIIKKITLKFYKKFKYENESK